MYFCRHVSSSKTSLIKDDSDACKFCVYAILYKLSELNVVSSFFLYLSSDAFVLFIYLFIFSADRSPLSIHPLFHHSEHNGVGI